MLINVDRFKKTMEQVNEIAVTSEGGVNRLALTDEDLQARQLLKAWMDEEDMAFRFDDAGNMYGTLEGSDPDQPSVCVGSHLDTQPNGGKYDGALGVLSGLEVIRTIRENNITTRRSIELINWTNEEGARFEPPLIGSGLVAGIFEKDWVHNLQDRNGIRFKDELVRIGYLGDESNRLNNAHAYLEMHIEQGPVLEKEGFPTGLVTGILGIKWFDITITGQADHAGPSPMSSRCDALMSTANILMKLKEHILNYGDPIVVTVGQISASPGTTNIIPGQVKFTVDLRHYTEKGLENLEKEMIEIIDAVCSKEGTSYEIAKLWSNPPTKFDDNIINTVEEAFKESNVPVFKITSGAGHDAKYISDIIPTGMLFVKSIGGKSHCPEEHSTYEDMGQAIQVLLSSVLKLAQ